MGELEQRQVETILKALSQIRTHQRSDDRSIIERSVSFLLLALICIFALNSIGNVQKYVGRFHHHWTGDALGIAFGTVVFVCAYIAATTHGSTRWVAIVIGTVFGVASAQFQADLYMSEGMQPMTARALSFIPILAGEVGLALLESLYSRQHRAEVRAAKTADKEADNHELDATIAALTDQLEQQSQRIQALHQQANSAGQAFANGQMQAAHGYGTGSNNGRRTGDLDLANDARAAQKQQRKAAIPEVLAAVGMPLSTGELRDRLRHMYGWEVSADSVRRYCQELEAEGIVESERRKWQLTDRHNLAQLPVQTAVGVPAVNGTGVG